MNIVDIESLIIENQQLRCRLEYEKVESRIKIDEITRLNIQIAIYIESIKSERDVKQAILSKLGDVEAELEFAKRQVFFSSISFVFEILNYKPSHIRLNI